MELMTEAQVNALRDSIKSEQKAKTKERFRKERSELIEENKSRLETLGLTAMGLTSWRDSSSTKIDFFSPSQLALISLSQICRDKFTSNPDDATALHDALMMAVLFARQIERDSMIQVKKSQPGKATKKRKLIGAASRDRVRKAAKEFMHLSKEQATPSIAVAAKLSAGTTRRYLSKLFPGDKWGTCDASPDTSQRIV